MEDEKEPGGHYNILYFMELKEGDDIEYIEFENRSDLTDAMMVLRDNHFPLEYNAKEFFIYERSENMLC